MSKVSDCCGAQGNGDYGICSQCGDHCTYIEVCEECGGELEETENVFTCPLCDEAQTKQL